jgi:hypothetical protein
MAGAVVKREGGFGGAPMSMYAELLAASFDECSAQGEETPEVGDLLARAIASRHRLTAGPAADAGPEGDLATNIEYDLALLGLCAARGIEGHPRRFDRPGEERRRLEEELAKRGIDLEELGSDGAVRSPRRGDAGQENDARRAGWRR